MEYHSSIMKQIKPWVSNRSSAEHQRKASNATQVPLRYNQSCGSDLLQRTGTKLLISLGPEPLPPPPSDLQPGNPSLQIDCFSKLLLPVTHQSLRKIPLRLYLLRLHYETFDRADVVFEHVSEGVEVGIVALVRESAQPRGCLRGEMDGGEA